jgi:hypothetical protein
MRAKLLALGTSLICFALIGACTARADSIPVANNSFEQTNPLVYVGPGFSYNLGPIPDWTTVSGIAESWMPGPLMTVPDGTMMALLSGTLSQDLGVTLTPDENYTLAVFVGDPGGLGNWSISLDAGSDVLCSSSGATSEIPAGTFVQETCSFATGATVPLGDLSVVLNATGTTPSGYDEYTAFDDVSVTTPEPATAGLLSLGLVLLALVGGIYKRKYGVQNPG